MMKAPIETETVSVWMSRGRTVEARLTYFPDYASQLSCIDIEVPALGRFEARENDYFECLLSLRRRLELQGAKLLCWGARRDVWVFGMDRDMGAGLTAELLTKDDEAPPAMQSIFSPAEPDMVGSVEEQRQFAMAWHKRQSER